MTDEAVRALRADLEPWLEATWDPDLSVDEWWAAVAEAGWSAPHLTPDQGGRGLHRSAINVVRQVFDEHGALRPPGGLGMLMAAPTILHQGTPDQIARHVAPILNGQVAWCQLFSEPGAGSDLAGLTTRAERDGDRWVLNGQKVWSSMAMDADYGMLLARTDFSAPKHAGISWFAFPLDQPGVTIRPLREMTGDAVFNEVFLDDAVCDAVDLVGGEGNGWTVTQTTLFFERTGIASGAHANWPYPGPKGGFLGRRAGDAAKDSPPVNDMIVSFAEVRDLARQHGRARDPHLRQDLAKLYSWNRIKQWNADRAKAAAATGGAEAIASTGKVSQTRITKGAAAIGVKAIGAHGMLAGDDGVDGGRFAKALVFSPAASIYGGTDEIQRNIAAERTLGLPRDILPGKGQPYDEVLRATRQDRS